MTEGARIVKMIERGEKGLKEKFDNLRLVLN